MARLVWWGSALGALAVAAGAAAAPLTTNSLTLYGTPGLIEMPTAESLPDAEIATTIARTGDDIRGTLTFQLHPRLTGSFRYAKLPDFNQNTNTDRFDRSFDVRFRFADETRWLPAMAIGLQDFIGTGVYSGEYVVATKSLSRKLRVTAGMGWGRLGTFGTIASIGNRPLGFVQQGGQTNTAQWFRGDMAPFFGLSYKATEKLTLKAEYSSDGYDYEVREGLIDRRTPWNFGLDYQLYPGATLGASYAYGDRFGVQLTFSGNPQRSSFGPQIGPAAAPLAVRPQGSAADLGWTDLPASRSAVQQAVEQGLAAEGITLEAMALTATSVELHISNGRWPVMSQAYGRSARVLSRTLPASVETITLVPVSSGVPGVRVTFTRSDLEEFENAPSEQLLAATRFTDAAGPAPQGLELTPGLYPRFAWVLRPDVATSFFDPEQPIRGDLLLRFAARYQPAPGWVASTQVEHRLTGNFDEVLRPSNSKIERVRSDAATYLAEGRTAVVNMQVAHYGRPGPNLYSRLTAGYLERMYAGVSGEMLWKPVDSRLALGVEVNAVKQRAFDGGFGFRDYETVTAFASAYYDLGKGYVGRIHAGQYLAGDLGATFALDRTFSNGWSIGAFASLTTVSPEDFGEGSFDKGIRMLIPLTWITGQPSTTVAGTILRPLTRDGGQRLEVQGRLYDGVVGKHERAAVDSWGMFWR